MFEIGRINCYGHCIVPEKWRINVTKGINRLYYIHSDNGGYKTGDRYHAFESGKLYFFPYTTEYTLFPHNASDGESTSGESQRVLHTYADFELIPPILSDDVLCFAPETELDRVALDLFVAGGKANARENTRTFQNEQTAKLCLGAISYLVSRIASSNKNVTTVNDPIVIKALEAMLASIDKPLSVSDIAKDCFLTTDSFIRRFKKCIGTTPYSYFKSLRLRTANYMLSDGKSLEEVAASVGYADASALLHALK